MPTICRFHGILIRMYHRDHAPPHFHVRYGKFKAQIEIVSLVVMRGRLPRRVNKLVREWAIERRRELKDNWRRLERDEPLLPIAPLE